MLLNNLIRSFFPNFPSLEPAGESPLLPLYTGTHIKRILNAYYRKTMCISAWNVLTIHSSKLYSRSYRNSPTVPFYGITRVTMEALFVELSLKHVGNVNKESKPIRHDKQDRYETRYNNLQEWVATTTKLINERGNMFTTEIGNFKNQKLDTRQGENKNRTAWWEEAKKSWRTVWIPKPRIYINCQPKRQ